MFEFHKDKQRYFNWQYLISKDYIVPFTNEYLNQGTQLNVLEIGSAEAGVLKAFTEKGHTCTGIELSEGRVELAKYFMKEEMNQGKISFLAEDIYDIDPEKDLPSKFDLIILKDVIEHIHDQESFIKKLKDFLKPGGKVFFGFPPWYMPFGGHQQVCSNKFLSMLPYYHLLPMGLYKLILKVFGENEKKIENLAEIKQTGISIERFQRILKKENYSILKRKFFLFNPIYKFKFGITPKEQFKLISVIPFFRNFYTTCVYYVVEVKS